MSDTEAAARAPAAGRLGSRYWRLWSASVVSNLGDGIDAAALPLLAATLTRDPRLVAGMAVAFTLPWLLFALPAGAIVDRLDRRKVMYRVNVVRAALVAVIALSVVTDTASIWLLYVLAFSLGSCETLFDNAAQSIMPSIVATPQLERANGRLYAGEVVTNVFVGPPIGGILFAVAASVPFWLDSASFLVAALLVATIAGSFRPAGAKVAGEKRSLRVRHRRGRPVAAEPPPAAHAGARARAPSTSPPGSACRRRSCSPRRSSGSTRRGSVCCSPAWPWAACWAVSSARGSRRRSAPAER